MPTQFTFADIVLPNVTNVSVGVPARAQGFSTPGVPGSRPPARLHADSRAITVQGVIINPVGSTFDDLQLAWSSFVSAHHMACVGGATGRLVVDTDWYYNAVPETMNDTRTDYGSKEYDITYRCYDPFRYSTTTSTHAGPTVDGAFVTVASTSPMDTPLSLTFTATATGTLKLTDSVYGRVFEIEVDQTGAWAVDGLARTVTRAGADKFGQQTKTSRMPVLAGAAAVGGSRDVTFTLDLTDVTLSACSLSWIRRSL